MISDEELQELETLLELEEVTENYSSYCEYVHRGLWILGDHLKLVCSNIEDLIYRRIKENVLIISMPPQHGKSQCVTETLPSYYLGKFPRKRVIEVSYGDDLARRFGRRNKQKVLEFGKDLFNLELSKGSSSDTEFEIAEHKGSMISRGIMAGITGQPADCFPKGTMIATEVGEIEISQLVTMINPPRVLSYNHERDIIVLKNIIARRVKNASKFTRLKTVCGNEITSTSDHRYYTKERGYTKASILRRGDTFISIRDNRMSDMQGQERQRKQNMQEVLQQDKENKSNIKMQLLRKRVRERKIRIREEIKKRSKGFLLFKRMYGKILQNQDCKKMSSLWEDNSKERQSLLFERVQRKSKTTQVCKEEMSYLRKRISAYIKKNGLLFKSLCRQSTFRKNERYKQFPLQRWNKLFKTIFRNKTIDKRKRLLSVCSLWKERRNTFKDEFKNTSCRREPNKQQAREFNNSMRTMSCNTPSFSTDTVQTIENFSTGENKVYDIQVEGTHNFFANGILVHNCIIIDDPIKNRLEAESQTYRDRIWDEFLNSIYTRLSAHGVIIVIMTRWHEDDLAGRLLNKDYGFKDKCKEINIPLEAEENDILKRTPGDALFPEIGKDNEWLKEFKKAYTTKEGNRAWTALMQGKPTATEGNMLKRAWWKYYDILPDKFDDLLQSWDCTFKDTDGTDYVVGQVWGRIGVRKYLVDQIRARMEFTETIKAIESLSAKYPKAYVKLIEDKANGSAIISVLRHKLGGIIPIVPKESKQARASAVSADIEAGNVYLPKYASFTNDFVNEAAAFPNGEHDDQVDGMSQALNRIIFHTTDPEKLKVPKDLPEDLKADLEADEKALAHYLATH